MRIIYFFLRYIKGIRTPQKLIQFAFKQKNNRLFIDSKKSLPQNELINKAAYLATRLNNMGFIKGDHVAIQCQNNIEFLIVRLACYYGGYVCCSLLDEFNNYALQEALIETKTSVFIHQRNYKNLAKFCPDLKLQINISELGSWTTEIKLLKRKRLSKSSEITAIGYTSGSTGKSKAVVWSNKAWIHSFYNFILNAKDKSSKNGMILHCMPFASSGSLSVLPAFMSGQKHLMLESFEAIRCLHYISQYEVTHLYLAPGFLYELFDVHKYKHPEFDLSSLIEISVGSAPFSPHKWQMFANYFDCSIKQGYGMSEVLAPVSFVSSKEIFADSVHWKSVGKIVPQIDLKTNTEGLVQLRSSTSCLGYLRNGEIDDSSFRDSYFCTQDLGEIDSEGFLFLKDREQNCFQFNGVKYSCVEMENKIHELQEIKDVKLVWNESKLHVYYLTFHKKHIESIQIELYLEKHYSSLKRYIEVHKLDAFPYTSSGKLRKNELVKQDVVSRELV